MSDDINLKLSVEEVNKILEILSQQPFIEVYKLIEKIHVQSNEANLPNQS